MNFSTFDVLKTLYLDTDKYIVLEGETLQRYQQILLSMAEEIISVCEEKGIYYQLSGGTALGAVRNGGFIPWDDDIDLNLLSGDMPRLAEALKEKYGEKYVIQDCFDPEYGNVTGKVRLRGTISRSREDVGLKECGFSIDLFSIENLFDNQLLYFIHGILCMGFGFLLSCRKFYDRRKLYRQIADQAPKVRRVFKTKIFIGRILSFMSVRRWCILTNACYSLCKNKKSRRVGIPSGRRHYFGETYLRDGMVRTTVVSFEGHRWQVAFDYDGYLTKLYGSDYMTPPNDNKKEKHFLLELIFPDEHNQEKQ